MRKERVPDRGVAEQRARTDSRRLGKTTEQCLDAFRLRSKLFAVNFTMDVGSEDNQAYRFVPLHGWLRLLIVSLGMQERGRGDYKRRRSRPSLERRLVLRVLRCTSEFWGRRLFLTIICQGLPFQS